MVLSMLSSFIHRNVIYEALLSYYLPNGKATAVPVGFKIIQDSIVILRIYKGSGTYYVISNFNPDCVINLTYDLNLFLKSTFKDIYGELPDEIFVKSTYVNAPIVKNCFGYLHLKPLEIEFFKDYLISKYKIVHFEFNNVNFVYTRAFSIILELLIYVSKVKYCIYDEFMLKLIDHYSNVIKRIDESGIYVNLCEEILKILNHYLSKCQQL